LLRGSIETAEGVSIMGGPWKARDPGAASRPSPAPRGQAGSPASDRAGDGEARIVVAYLVSLIVAAALAVALMTGGWVVP
jgi:hypothetical protein